MTVPTRFGILGFGHHAIKRLVPAFHGAHHATLHGLWRRDPAKAADNARDFAIPLTFDTPQALCASPDLDAIFVVSPDALHLEHVLLALQHGKPVLCEKPLAMSVAEAEQMLAAATNANLMLGVAQNMRYNACLVRMKQWIEEGRIGQTDTAHAQFSYATDRSPRAWIHDPQLARGGPIGDVGIHCIDALCFVLGRRADTIQAVTTLAQARAGELESKAVVALEYTSGALGAVTVSGQASYRSLVEVTGTTGVLTCESAMTIDHPVHLVHRRGGEVVSDELISNADAFSQMLDSFAAAIVPGKQDTYLASAAEGVMNQRVLDAAYESWRQARRIELTTPA